MDDVNMKIDRHIESQFPSETENYHCEPKITNEIDSINMAEPCPQQSFCRRQSSTLFGGSSLMMEIHQQTQRKCSDSKVESIEEEEEESAYASFDFPSKKWNSTTSCNRHYNDVYVYSATNSNNHHRTNVSYNHQYESNKEGGKFSF